MQACYFKSTIFFSVFTLILKDAGCALQAIIDRKGLTYDTYTKKKVTLYYNFFWMNEREKFNIFYHFQPLDVMMKSSSLWLEPVAIPKSLSSDLASMEVKKNHPFTH